MGRPQTIGLSYFPFDVDFFSDKKTKILKARYGSDGVQIYLYILCQIYREGYFIKCDEDFRYIISDDLGIKSETVEQVITYLCVRSMFDEQVYASAEVLTSHGIQKRWQEAIKSRASKTPIKVDDFWLLSKEETATFIHYALFDNSSEKNDGFSEKNDDNSEKNDTKKRKEKEIKEEYTPSISPSRSDVKSFFCRRGREDLFEKFFSHYESVDWKLYGKIISDWKAVAIRWIENPKNKIDSEKIRGNRASEEEMNGIIADSKKRYSV